MKYEELEEKVRLADDSKRENFIMIEIALINNINYTVYEKLVYLSLYTYAWRTKSCFPGQKAIADNLGISRKTVNLTIKSLEEKGALISLHQYKENDRRSSNIYFLASVDPITGEFNKESLNHVKEFKGEKIKTQGK